MENETGWIRAVGLGLGVLALGVWGTLACSSTPPPTRAELLMESLTRLDDAVRAEVADPARADAVLALVDGFRDEELEFLEMVRVKKEWLTKLNRRYDADRADFEGLRVLVVGGGHSAATTLLALAKLPDTEVFWVTRSGSPPVPVVDDDPLPARKRLAEAANQLAAEPPPDFHHIPEASIIRLVARGDAIGVRIHQADGNSWVDVDRIVAKTGFHPDNSLYRELQVHECYASQGPMKLAASLLGSDSGDCMTQAGFGPDSLANPEPSFFIVGNKSYGRNGNFLLRIGREQVRDIFRLITGDETLDLNAAEKSRV